MSNFHDFELDTIEGDARSLSEYKGKVCLVVNVASKCGLTPQYDGLQRLYERYQGRDFEILGLPCNQFAGQEPAADAEIKSFCTSNYGVSFPLFSKLEVNGDGRHALYAWLTQQDTQPEPAGDIKWNFGKFVIDKSGQVAARFEPPTEPEAADLVAVIDKALG